MQRVIPILIATALLAGACSSGTSDSATEPTATVNGSAPTAAPEPDTAPDAEAEPAEGDEEVEAAPAPRPPTIDDLLGAGVLNIAHAGGDQDYPHSTMYAFAQAVEAGADVLELDVQLSSDGVLVAQHDDTIDRTTNSTGNVADFTVAELQAFDAAHWFSSVCWRCDDLPEAAYELRGVRTGDVAPPPGFSPDDFGIATLAEISERFPSHPLDIEIKVPQGDTTKGIEVADALAVALTELDRLDSTVVVSFDDAVVDAFHEAAPSVEVSPGLDRLTNWVLAGTPLDDHFRIIQVPPFSSGIQVVSADSVQRAHDEGLAVWVWPDDASWQETEAYYQQLLGYGADAVLAGRPGQMSAARNAGPWVVPTSAGCGDDTATDEISTTVQSGGIERTFLLFVPSSYDEDEPMPVVLNFHGFTSTASQQVLLSELDVVAQAEGFISVAPQGIGPPNYWNFTNQPGLAADVEFVADLLDHLETALCIDTSRIYATGLSNGGYMSSRLACDLSGRIAAVAAVAATTFFDDCDPSRPVPLLSVHGTDDQIVPFTGVRTDSEALEATGLAGIELDPEFAEMFDEVIDLDIASEVAQWADHNGCGPAIERRVGSDTTISDYQGCDGPVDFYVVADGGHSWPGSDFLAPFEAVVGLTTLDFETAEVAWAFFRQHRLD